MKTITSDSIKTTVTDLNREVKAWMRIDRGHRACIMLDTDDARIWLDKFVDQNSWVRYDSTSVVNLSSASVGPFGGCSDEDLLDNACDLLTESGWTIT